MGPLLGSGVERALGLRTRREGDSRDGGKAQGRELEGVNAIEEVTA